MSRRKRPGRVTKQPRKLNGWATGKNMPGPIRRRLRSATLFDRCLIALAFFVLATFTTGALYFYLSTHSGKRRSPYGFEYETPRMPLETLTGIDARYHFLLVCLAGGLIGIGIYLYLTLRDPYGTTTADKAAEEEQATPKKDRFAFLQERETHERQENTGAPATPHTPPDQ